MFLTKTFVIKATVVENDNCMIESITFNDVNDKTVHLTDDFNRARTWHSKKACMDFCMTLNREQSPTSKGEIAWFTVEEVRN